MPSWRIRNFGFSARSALAVPFTLAAGRGRYVRALCRELGRGRQFGKGRIHSTQSLCLRSKYIPGHWMEIGKKWVTRMVD
jgi:hypothetical protein